jgi:hypothetical protein
LGGYVKGAGVDCATFIACYLQECGFAKRSDFDSVGIYGHDWFCHTTSERYLSQLMRHVQKTMDTLCVPKVAAALPGSIVLFKAVRSRVFNHGGIVTEWPFILHASTKGVMKANATHHFLTARREMAIFDPWSADAAR